MKTLLAIAVPVILALIFSPQLSYGQITAINIAQGKKIEATSTCGVGVGEKELFCKLATVPGKFAISGLSCDYCDPLTPSSNHSIEYAIDGTENWWQSPPLSRGLQYQQVNITIDLGRSVCSPFSCWSQYAIILNRLLFQWRNCGLLQLSLSLSCTTDRPDRPTAQTIIWSRDSYEFFLSVAAFQATFLRSWSQIPLQKFSKKRQRQSH